MGQRLRAPAVAGSFYSSDRETLVSDIEKYLEGESEKETREALGCICPHAGYYYSGHVAGVVMASVEVPDRVILIGPNHRGRGASAALDDSDGWEFPFGVVAVDKELNDALAGGCSLLKYDSSAHANEHSLEVIVPFLYVRNPSVTISAISLSQINSSDVGKIADAVADAAVRLGALIVASTDMTHYRADEKVRLIDGRSIEMIKDLDCEALMEKVSVDKSLCGAPAVAATIAACRKMGATSAELIRYATSGDIEDRRDSVVGYAGFRICG